MNKNTFVELETKMETERSKKAIRFSLSPLVPVFWVKLGRELLAPRKHWKRRNAKRDDPSVLGLELALRNLKFDPNLRLRKRKKYSKIVIMLMTFQRTGDLVSCLFELFSFGCLGGPTFSCCLNFDYRRFLSQRERKRSQIDVIIQTKIQTIEIERLTRNVKKVALFREVKASWIDLFEQSFPWNGKNSKDIRINLN